MAVHDNFFELVERGITARWWAIEKLQETYGGERGTWGQHWKYEVALWQNEVRWRETRLGYWEWVIEQILSGHPRKGSLEYIIGNALETEAYLCLELEPEEIMVLNADSRLAEWQCWHEHPEYSLDFWIDEVEQDDTRRGYWRWLIAELELEYLDQRDTINIDMREGTSLLLAFGGD